MTLKEIIKAKEHFWYGISHDIFSEPVTSYAKTAVEALDKQIPKKANVSIKGTTDFNTSAHCPTCHKILIGSIPKYCSNCGQVIDWSSKR